VLLYHVCATIGSASLMSLGRLLYARVAEEACTLPRGLHPPTTSTAGPTVRVEGRSLWTGYGVMHRCWTTGVPGRYRP
jgi:hypothetical protein